MKDLKVIISAVIIFIFAVFIMFLAAFRNSNVRAYKLYNQGLDFYYQNDFQNAYFNFSKISVFSDIYEIALLKQGICALNAGDKKTAYKKFKYISFVSRNSHIVPIALYNAALINMEHKKYSYAYKKFKKIYSRYPDSDYKKASAYQLGILLKNKNAHFAKDYFIEYLDYAPSGRYSLSAIDEIINLKIYLTDSEKVVVANAYFENQMYKNVLSILKDINSPSAALLLAKSYEKSADMQNALSCYLKTLSLCDENLSQKEIATVVSKCILLYGVNSKDACELLLKTTKKTVAYPAVLFEYASYLSEMNSIKCYETIYKKYPDSYQAAQSLWHVFLYMYKNGYTTKAKTLAEEYLDSYSNKNSTAAIKFWHAKILLQEKKTHKAKQELKELIKTEPDSYYAFVANNLLNDIHTPFNVHNLDEIKKFEGFTKKDLVQIFNSDQTLINVAMLNDIDLLNKFRLHDNFMLSYIAYVQNNIPYSVFLAKKGFFELDFKPQHTDARYKLAYPIEFNNIINQYSKKYSQNPYLMLSLMREESTFNKDAKSTVGAVGLMQLMPDTASSLGFGIVNYDGLVEPDFNVNLGIKYFSMLCNMFNKNEMLAVLAYNGGPSNVTNWTNKLKDMDFDEFVEDIPYSETQNYIKRVFGTYWNYTKIYSY